VFRWLREQVGPSLGSARAPIALLSVIHFAIPVGYVAGGPARINAFLTNDDTYYYLQTAWNARQLGFVTFDGINPTNGVQFLWFSILYGLSFLTNDKSAFLAMASTLSIAFTCLPYFIIWRFSSNTWQSPRSLLAVFMALLWFVICLYQPNRYLIGLESPLHAFLIWTIVLQFTRIYHQVSHGAVRSSSVLFFIVLLVLTTWTRLDSFGLSASFLVLLLFTTARRVPIVTYAVGSAIIAIGTVALFAFFELAGGSLLPVSALVKGYDVDRFNLGSFYNWSLVLFPLRIPGANLLNVLGIVAMFGSLAIVLRMRTAAHDHNQAALRLIAIALSASVIIHSIATFGMFRYYYFWYLSATFVYWTVVLAMFSVEVVRKKAWSYRATGVSGVALGVLLVCFWWLGATPDNLSTTRYEVANWMNANLEDDSIVGSFNSGQLGFFSDQSVVNLDGLINNVTYFDAVIQNDSPEALLAYIDRVGIDYLVDYLFGRWRELIDRKFTTVREFRLASGGAIKIMKRAPDVPSRGAVRPP
jgi:hypothetical protein